MALVLPRSNFVLMSTSKKISSVLKEEIIYAYNNSFKVKYLLMLEKYNWIENHRKNTILKRILSSIFEIILPLLKFFMSIFYARVSSERGKTLLVF